MRPVVLAFALFGGCAPRGAEPTDGWWDSGIDYNVEEPLEFTSTPYAFDGGISDLAGNVFPTPSDGFVFAPEDDYGDARCTTTTSSDLPDEITGVVTISPHFYFKTSGCTNDDEKYYGSFFLQDGERAVFVLGDTKAAHFTVGDVITIDVRGVRTRSGLDMVYSWDLVSVDPQGAPIFYETQAGPFGAADISRVKRVEGDVTTTPDTFGAFVITSDSGQSYGVQLDAELSRRGITFTTDDHIVATGPVLFSYSEYNVIIQSVGQIQ